MQQPVIDIRGLSVSFGHKRVLTNINLQVFNGNVYGVIGPNGAGKSTLFKAVLGLLDYELGDIDVWGEEVDEVRKRIAYVPQKDDVDWSFPATVKDIVLMGRYPFKSIFQRLDDSDNAKADKAMNELGILDLKDRQIGQLSGGQQQRVFLARALCQEADLYFLDEPFVGVDIATEEKIIATIKNLAAAGKTLLVVHHDLSTVNDYFDKVILLNQRLIACGDTEEVFTNDNIKYAYGGQLTILHKMGIKN